MSYRSILSAAVLAYSLALPGLARAVPVGAPTKRPVETSTSKAKALANSKERGERRERRVRIEAASRVEVTARGPAKTKQKSSLTTKTKAASKKKPAARCFSPEVHIVRKRGDEIEHRDLALTFCDGRPNPSALDSLSVLARSRDAERPLIPEIRAYQRRDVAKGPASRRRRPGYLSENVMLVHAGLLERLQKVADHFKGKTIEVISGHRPDARDTSRHHHGRALDFRVDGVSREALRDFIRKFEATGVGYYPNSYFVHMDVRDDKGYWVDRSGPGEAADYGPWPPSRRDVERAQQRVLASALSQLAELATPITPSRPEPKRVEVVRADDEPSDQALQRDEIAKIRAEALAAIKGL
jgi:hypothetical protein